MEYRKFDNVIIARIDKEEDDDTICTASHWRNAGKNHE